MIKISPSILAADFTKLGNEIESIANADYIHFDVMDGVFVRNISFGFPVLESVRAITDKTLDVHLMIQSPSQYAAKFAAAGADIITFHIEAEEPDVSWLNPVASDRVRNTIDTIHSCGKKAGLTLRPSTPAAAVIPYIDRLDLVLVMTVEPGYGGQEFLPRTLSKVSEIRAAIDRVNPKCELEVDGGINIETAKLCVSAGANVLVAGIDVFSVPDRAAHIEELRGSV
ncbi:MAG: ribulose-phosphate 3-epimerase [Oscillospiraceae bacterium]|nr:ribulose-phosphate 3-epimerase [Oscillospiraceae bacterium]